MASTRSTYSHEPLEIGKDKIRLLTLLPDLDEDGLIHCGIATYDLATAPEFQALSYEWGSTERPRDIRVDHGLLSVRQNLWLFLDMFRSQELNRTFIWIDQICIDQQNNTERGHQVKLMGSIYSNAVRTIAWLGPSTGVDTGLSTALSRHDHLINHWSRGILTFEEYAAQQARVAANVVVPTEEARVIEGWKRNVQNLYDSSYWTRLWIIQENVLARDCEFFRGTHRWSRSELSRCVGLELQHHCFMDREMSRFSRHVEALTNLVEPMNDSPLERVLIEVWRDHLKCSDPHDVVYSLLGLVKPAQRIPIDYQFTLSEVYDQLMDAVMMSSSLYETLMENRASGLAVNLERIGYQLGPSLRWDSWLHRPHRTFSARNSQRLLNHPGYLNIQSFLSCLGYLEHIGLRKERWSAPEIGAIVHTAWQLEHTLLPSQSFHLSVLDIEPFSSLECLPECRSYVSRINCATHLDLMPLLSKIVGSARKRIHDDPCTWEQVLDDVRMGNH